MAFLPSTTSINKTEFFKIYNQSTLSKTWIIGSANKYINVIVFVHDTSEDAHIETTDFVLEERANMWVITLSDASFPSGGTGHVHIFELGDRPLQPLVDSKPWNTASIYGTLDILSGLPYNKIKLTFDTNEQLMLYKRNSILGEEYEEYTATPFSAVTGTLLFNSFHSVFVGTGLSLSEGKIHTLVTIEGAIDSTFETITRDTMFVGLSKTINQTSTIDRYNTIPFTIGTSVKRISEDVYVQKEVKKLSIPLFLVYN